MANSNGGGDVVPAGIAVSQLALHSKLNDWVAGGGVGKPRGLHEIEGDGDDWVTDSGFNNLDLVFGI